MKNKLWLFQIPVIAFFAFAFWVTDAGVQGNLRNAWLSSSVYPRLRSLHGWFTNAKFQLRGEEERKNNIVIIAIDDDTLADPTIGRWPWHRDRTAMLIDSAYKLGAKTVSLDAVFSERDPRASDGIELLFKMNHLEQYLPQLETDPELTTSIKDHADSLILGYTITDKCQPVLNPDNCSLPDTKSFAEAIGQSFQRYSYDELKGATDGARSPLVSALSVLPNLQEYTEASKYGGYFDADPDTDGYIRRENLATLINGLPYPPLALVQAKIAKGEKLGIQISADQKIQRLYWVKSNTDIPVSPLGIMEINFRGKAHTFPYLSAKYAFYPDLLNKEEDALIKSRTPATSGQNDEVESKLQNIKFQRGVIEDIKRGAHVLIGVTALGVFDMRQFPFDSNVAGVEGHATILDNLLSNDMLTYGSSRAGGLIIFVMMTIGALLFAYATERLESVPALLLFIIAMGGFGFFDVKYLFAVKHVNWNTSLLMLEMSTVFVLTMAAKYVIEERNKKFIKGAFSKYVAPTIVDSILKDPTKLSVGGEKRELTILFSDIRSFTTFSEKMDPKILAQFLNDYLGIMTDIVFECEGTLDKYIGDALMAFWGAPLDQPNHAANACKAAIRMQQELLKHQPRYKEKYGVDVNVGIGLNSGPVNVGNMGSERIFEYTVIGDHVNLASRLEGLTKYYSTKIVTTRFTFDCIAAAQGETPRHRVLDFVKVKGKKKAIELIELLPEDLDPRGLELFELGRKAYSTRQFDDATALFGQSAEVLGKGPGEPDGPSQMYLERIEELKKSPPDADWDGSWEMTSK